jgi:hypothetical protein
MNPDTEHDIGKRYLVLLKTVESSGVYIMNRKLAKSK